MKPQHWSAVYPQGTEEGNEEFEFFNALCRHKDKWRSVSSLATDSGLSEKVVERIIQKYFHKDMIFQHERHDDHWAYWENVPERLPKKYESIMEKDHRLRIDSLKEEEDGPKS